MGRGAIVVTGASRGIGAAIARDLAGRGFIVGCLSRSGALPEADTVDDADRLIPIAVDVTDEAGVANALSALVETAGGLKGLVNNAGIHEMAKSRDLTASEFARIMSVNATAPFVISRLAYPYLAESRGTIVMIGSMFDRLGVPENLAYCASKAAVAAMTRCLAVEWARDGIRVLNIAPGYIVTDLNRAALETERLAAYLRRRIPTGGPGNPGDVARLVGTLFTEDLPFLTGETITLDGGQSIAH